MKHRVRREMRKHKSLQSRLTDFERYLKKEERSPAMVEKYTAVVRGFMHFAEERCGIKAGCRLRGIDKETILAYKHSLIDSGRSAATVNSRLSAIRSYLRFMGREDIEIKNMKCQRRSYIVFVQQVSSINNNG